MEHADDGGALVVGNVIKDLVDLVRVADGHFDRVRVLKAVQIQRRRRHVRDELRPNLELGEQMVHAERLHERGVAFVQPQVSPPFLFRTIRNMINCVLGASLAGAKMEDLLETRE